jgi:hypothetical protein
MSEKPSKGLFHWFGSLIRDLDLFGTPIQLKYKKRFESNSILGGCISLCFVSGIAIYFALLITLSYNFTSGNITSILEKTNMGMNPTRSLNLNINNFDIAIGFLNGG